MLRWVLRRNGAGCEDWSPVLAEHREGSERGASARAERGCGAVLGCGGGRVAFEWGWSSVILGECRVVWLRGGRG
jgi:hypothetical protein